MLKKEEEVEQFDDEFIERAFSEKMNKNRQARITYS